MNPKIASPVRPAPWTLAALVAAACAGSALGQEPLPRPTPLAAALAPATAAQRIEVKVGQGRFLTLNQDLADPRNPNAIGPFLAVGDPNILDFYQVDARRIRLIGKALGATDFTIVNAAGETLDFEVRVTADLDGLRDHLRDMFPDASLELSQLREKIVVGGEARDADQVSRIIATIDGFLRSTQRIHVAGRVIDREERPQDPNVPLPPLPEGDLTTGTGPGQAVGGGLGVLPSQTSSGGGSNPAGIVVNQIASNQIQVVNLIRIPTSQQVLLKVRVAELNRTGFRQIGADFLATIPEFGALFGTQIAGNGLNPGRVGPITRNVADLTLGSQATAFGTFSNGQFNAILTALRRNNLVKILAEPNLVALNGHQANFLAGGEFPVPSFSGVGSGAVGGGGVSGTQFKEFGVRLSFLPTIIDGDTVRLTVDPEVSSVDFSLATTLVPGGSPVPGLSVRKSHTTVELKEGETLAIAGLMQLELSGSTQRIPGLGDLPYIGEFFSNTTSNRIEKELIVLVTPYIVEPMAAGQVPPTPGDEVAQPNDLEFFFMNRIEGRTGVDQRSTTSYDDPLHLIRHSIVERRCLIGPSGFSK